MDLDDIIADITIWWSKHADTPPIQPPPVQPPPVQPPPDTGLVRGSMFIPQQQPRAPWITSGPDWPDSTQAYARCHGNPWEGAYRVWLLTALHTWGANAVVYFADKFKGMIELEMFLADTASPVDGHHINDGENSCVWLKKAGINIHVPILTDSPQWTIGMDRMESFIQDLAAAYRTARDIRVVWLIGLECDRNMNVGQVCQVADWVRNHVGASAEVVCGSQNGEFLKQVHTADGRLGLWLEQPGHPIFQALTSDTAPAYLALLDDLAKLGVPLYAGEWWARDDATRKAITAQLTAKGIHCGCGQWA